MTQKKYQKLSADNHLAAREIWEELKEEKCISQDQFEIVYANARGISYGGRKSGSFHNLYKTTQQFLFDHGLMTKEFINGLIIYVATQKCFRCKTFENATKEVQEVTNSDIDRAIGYVVLNNNQVPAQYEAPIVANMLGLEGGHWKYFVKTYIDMADLIENPSYHVNIKYKVVAPIQDMVHKGMIKKI